jgi:hypothetical protein
MTILVKFLIVKNHHLKDGYINTKILKILQEETENLYLKKTMVRENPKPYRTGNIIVHGLFCCKNGCGYWNRDVNGATNIYKIAYNAINNKERPNYLSRSKNLSTGLDEPVKPKFTRSVKGKPY